ncbi:hypothetical protein CJ030_MR1G014053 [Morella rubra]|uniref:TCTP domain-containing protein n=1 Tax=Morella rubra TaxID=262757 RepID=A0A6A1WMK9_9ROSI|nr:hypothetical protein CJ030_MR1G014053 [Morella rubra]
MLVYQDLLTGDELLSDSFPYKEIENGMLWDVYGKWVIQGAVDVDIHYKKVGHQQRTGRHRYCRFPSSFFSANVMWWSVVGRDCCVGFAFQPPMFSFVGRE